MHYLIDQMLAVCIIELGDAINMGRSLSDQGALDQEGFEILNVVLGRKLIDITEELRFRDTNEGVFNSGGEAR